MPSPTSSTVPTSSSERSMSKFSISFLRTEVISSGRMLAMSVPLGRREELLLQGRELGLERAVDDAVADADRRAAEDRRVHALVERDRHAALLLEARLDRGAELVGERARDDDVGVHAVLG